MSGLPEGFKPTSEALRNREQAERISSFEDLLNYIDNLPDNRYSEPEREALKTHAAHLRTEPYDASLVRFVDGTAKPFPQELRNVLPRIPNPLPENLGTFGDQETRSFSSEELRDPPFTSAHSLEELIDLIARKSASIKKMSGVSHILKQLDDAIVAIEKIKQSELSYAEISKFPESIRDTVFRIVTDPGTDVILVRAENGKKELGWSIAASAQKLMNASSLPLLKVEGEEAGTRIEESLNHIYLSPRQERNKSLQN